MTVQSPWSVLAVDIFCDSLVWQCRLRKGLGYDSKDHATIKENCVGDLKNEYPDIFNALMARIANVSTPADWLNIQKNLKIGFRPNEFDIFKNDTIGDTCRKFSVPRQTSPVKENKPQETNISRREIDDPALEQDGLDILVMFLIAIGGSAFATSRLADGILVEGAGIAMKAVGSAASFIIGWYLSDVWGL